MPRVERLILPDRDPSVGEFVVTRRKAANLTQRELGDLAGVGKRFLVELESGKPTLKVDKINQVLAVFGMRLGPVAAAPAEVNAPERASAQGSTGREPPSEGGRRSSA